MFASDWNEYATVALTAMVLETLLDIDQRLEEIGEALRGKR